MQIRTENCGRVISLSDDLDNGWFPLEYVGYMEYTEYLLHIPMVILFYRIEFGFPFSGVIKTLTTTLYVFCSLNY